MKSGSILISLWGLASSQCTSQDDFVSIAAGRLNAHGVQSMAFDVEADTNDILVGGLVNMYINPLEQSYVGDYKIAKGFIYYMSDSTCSIEWVHFEEGADLGVTSVAFDPHQNNRVVALVATMRGPYKLVAFEDYAGPHPRIMLQHEIPGETNLQQMKLQFSSKSNQVIIVDQEKVVFMNSWSGNAFRYGIVFASNKDTILGTHFDSNLGLLTVQYNGTDKNVRLLLISESNNQVTIDQTLVLAIKTPPYIEPQEISAVSAKRNGTNDADMIAVVFLYESSQGQNDADIFSIQRAVSDGGIQSHQRITIADVSFCLAVASQTDGSAYALVQPSNALHEVNLIQVDFTAKKIKEKLAPVYSNLAFSNPFGLFVNSGPDFYASVLVLLQGYVQPTGLVFTSLESGRKSKLLPTNWGSEIDVTNDACPGDCVQVGSAPTSQRKDGYGAQVQAFHHNFISGTYELKSEIDINVADSNSLRFNTGPYFPLKPIKTEIILTHGLALKYLLPKVFDLENDDIVITIENFENPFLELNVVSEMSQFGDMDYYMVSETLSEKNVKLGESHLHVTWTDFASNRSIDYTPKLKIIPPYEYEAQGITQTTAPGGTQNGQGGRTGGGSQGGGNSGDNSGYKWDKDNSKDEGQKSESSCRKNEETQNSQRLTAEDCENLLTSNTFDFSNYSGYSDQDDQNGYSGPDAGVNLDYEDLLDKFMTEQYGTVENYQRSYGGPVVPKKVEFTKNGVIEIKFNREVQFPRELLIDYDPAYEEHVPELTPTEEEAQAIQKELEALEIEYNYMQEQSRQAYDECLIQLESDDGEEHREDGEHQGETQCDEEHDESNRDSEERGNEGQDSHDGYDNDHQGGGGYDYSGGGGYDYGGGGGYDDYGGGGGGYDDYGGGGGGYDDYGGGGGGYDDYGGGGYDDYGDGRRLRMLQAEEQIWQRDPQFELSIKDRLKLEIIDNSEDDQFIQDLRKLYTWDIKQASPSKMEIQVDFEFPELFRDVDVQFQVQAQFSDFEPGWQDDQPLIVVAVPSQKVKTVSKKTIQKVQASARTAKGATAATLGSRVILSGAMSQVWGMINGLQLFVFLPLFKVDFPEVSLLMIDSLIAIATFDAVPSDDIFVLLLDAPIDEEVGNDRLDEVQFGSPYMTINLGTFYLTFWIFFIIGFLIFITWPCGNKYQRLRNKQNSCLISLKGNTWIRSLLEGFLDIATCCVINYNYKRASAQGFQFDTAFNIINNISLIILGVACIVFPIWSLIFYCYYFDKWSDEKFQERYSTMLEGTRITKSKLELLSERKMDLKEKNETIDEEEIVEHKRNALAFNIIFLCRRAALVIAVTVLTDHLFAQILIMFIFSGIQVFYLTTYLPMEETLMQKLELFNEFTGIMLVNLLPIFSAYNPNASSVEADFLFLSLLILNVFVHLTFLILGMIQSVKLRIKRWCLHRKYKLEKLNASSQNQYEHCTGAAKKRVRDNTKEAENSLASRQGTETDRQTNTKVRFDIQDKVESASFGYDKIGLESPAHMQKKSENIIENDLEVEDFDEEEEKGLGATKREFNHNDSYDDSYYDEESDEENEEGMVRTKHGQRPHLILEEATRLPGSGSAFGVEFNCPASVEPIREVHYSEQQMPLESGQTAKSISMRKSLICSIGPTPINQTVSQLQLSLRSSAGKITSTHRQEGGEGSLKISPNQSSQFDGPKRFTLQPSGMSRNQGQSLQRTVSDLFNEEIEAESYIDKVSGAQGKIIPQNNSQIREAIQKRIDSHKIMAPQTLPARSGENRYKNAHQFDSWQQFGDQNQEQATARATAQATARAKAHATAVASAQASVRASAQKSARASATKRVQHLQKEQTMGQKLMAKPVGLQFVRKQTKAQKFLEYIEIISNSGDEPRIIDSTKFD